MVSNTVGYLYKRAFVLLENPNIKLRKTGAFCRIAKEYISAQNFHEV